MSKMIKIGRFLFVLVVVLVVFFLWSYTGVNPIDSGIDLFETFLTSLFSFALVIPSNTAFRYMGKEYQLPDVVERLEERFISSDITTPGLEWYARESSRIYNRSRGWDVSMAITALCSPRLSWEDNVTMAQDILSGNVNPESIGRLTHLTREKIVRVLSGESPKAVVKGGKVEPFYHSLRTGGLTHRVAVDKWMIEAALSIPKGVKQNTPSPRLYAILETAFRLACERVNQIDRYSWINPAQFQSGLWDAIRSEYEA